MCLAEAAVPRAPCPRPCVPGSVQILLNGQVSLSVGRGTGLVCIGFQPEREARTPARAGILTTQSTAAMQRRAPGEAAGAASLPRGLSPAPCPLAVPALFCGEFRRPAQATGTRRGDRAAPCPPARPSLGARRGTEPATRGVLLTSETSSPALPPTSQKPFGKSRSLSASIASLKRAGRPYEVA